MHMADQDLPTYTALTVRLVCINGVVLPGKSFTNALTDDPSGFRYTAGARRSFAI